MIFLRKSPSLSASPPPVKCTFVAQWSEHIWGAKFHFFSSLSVISYELSVINWNRCRLEQAWLCECMTFAKLGVLPNLKTQTCKMVLVDHGPWFWRSLVYITLVSGFRQLHLLYFILFPFPFSNILYSFVTLNMFKCLNSHSPLQISCNSYVSFSKTVYIVPNICILWLTLLCF